MSVIANLPLEELAIGQSACLVRTLTPEDLARCLEWTADVDPPRVDRRLMEDDGFRSVAAQRLLGGLWVSTLVATQLPGPGSTILQESLRYTRPFRPGDTVTVSVSVAALDMASRQASLECRAVDAHGEEMMSGHLTVAALGQKLSRANEDGALADRHRSGHRYEQLIGMTRHLAPLRTAVVHPVDAPSLVGAIEAARQSLIVPVLVGPEHKIRAVAEQTGIDLAGVELMGTEHSDAAAEQAVALARSGQVEALMKGALHTDELMRAVVHPEQGLRTARRISHVFAIDAPAYPRPLFVTDAAVNIYPSLVDKRDIAQNAIDLCHALGISRPKVAILSAVETVTDSIRSTLDAAALCKMADRGQITGAVLDGPLAFDNAVSAEAARTKGIVSPVAGQADIFLVPDLEAGNMLAKQLEYLAHAQVAGIVLGARVPIILTSRADKTMARMGSCAIALLLARHRQGGPT